MPLTGAGPYFRRRDVVWRDLGTHVLALNLMGDQQVLVLGGGNAVLWRLLATAHRLDDISAAFSTEEERPTKEQIVHAIAELQTLDLVSASSSGGAP